MVRMDGDFTELRVHEVLEDAKTKVATALRIEATWGTRRPDGGTDVWSRSLFVVAAVGPLANVQTDDRLVLSVLSSDQNEDGPEQ